MERAFEAETGGQYDIDVDKANEGNVTYTSTEGDKIQVATGEDLKLPDTWPETLPVFPNGKITYAGTVNTTENTTGLMVSYTVSNSASDVIAFYKEKLAANGWVIGVVSETTSGSMVSATNASEDSVALYAVTSNGETTVSLTAELKK
jgi:hypothetical protein